MLRTVQRLRTASRQMTPSAGKRPIPKQPRSLMPPKMYRPESAAGLSVAGATLLGGSLSVALVRRCDWLCVLRVCRRSGTRTCGSCRTRKRLLRLFVTACMIVAAGAGSAAIAARRLNRRTGDEPPSQSKFDGIAIWLPIVVLSVAYISIADLGSWTLVAVSQAPSFRPRCAFRFSSVGCGRTSSLPY